MPQVDPDDYSSCLLMNGTLSIYNYIEWCEKERTVILINYYNYKHAFPQHPLFTVFKAKIHNLNKKPETSPEISHMVENILTAMLGTSINVPTNKLYHISDIFSL